MDRDILLLEIEHWGTKCRKLYSVSQLVDFNVLSTTQAQLSVIKHSQRTS